MLEKGQKLRLKRAMWGHKPGTVGKVTRVHPATPVNAYTAQMKFKGSPKMSVADKDLDDLLEPVPVAEGRHKPGCQCGFCKNMGRGFSKKQDAPGEPAKPEAGEKIEPVAEAQDEQAKWDAILAANPVLREKGFASKVAKWNALRDAAEAAGLDRDEQVKFIAYHMQKDDKMESWLPTPPAEDKAIAPPSLNPGQVKAALLHDEFPVQEAAYDIKNVGKPRNRCECSDPGCPHCHGGCNLRPVTNLRRIDMEDVTGTMMCRGCAADALASGVFREDIGAKIKYR